MNNTCARTGVVAKSHPRKCRSGGTYPSRYVACFSFEPNAPLKRTIWRAFFAQNVHVVMNASGLVLQRLFPLRGVTSHCVQIAWSGEDGVMRTWECAQRRTRVCVIPRGAGPA